MKTLVFFCLFLAHIALSSSSRKNLKVSTSIGFVEGKSVVAGNGKQLDVWLGIPYAKSPSNDLRFKLPVPVQKTWKGIWKATKHPKICWQDQGLEIMGNVSQYIRDEDCLYLSIYVPMPRPKNASVYFRVDGISFVAGASYGDRLDFETFVTETNTIVVTAQHRLGAFGFLYTESTDAPGNMALYDLREALMWVHANIAAFGGSKEKVTLWGSGSGIISSFLIFHKPSWNLFAHSIHEGGSILYPSIIKSKLEATKFTLLLASKLNCSDANSTFSKIVECLRRVNATEIVKHTFLTNFVTIPFVVTVDGSFLTENPRKLLIDGNFKRSNNLIGMASDETANFFGKLGSYITQYLGKYINKFMHFEGNQFNSFLNDLIKYEYTNGSSQNYDSELNEERIVRMTTDYNFICRAIEFASLIDKHPSSNVYFYEFHHRPSFSSQFSWVKATHFDSHKFIFGSVLNLNTTTKEEKELSRLMMDFWTNFASRGDPNVYENGTKTGIQWPKWSTVKQEYLSLMSNSQVKKNLRARNCYFWNVIFPQAQKVCIK